MSPPPDTPVSALNTDLYELTMAAAYFEAGRQAEWVTFELFARRLPPRRRFLVAAGLADALAYLQQLRFKGREIDFVRSLPPFAGVDDAFWDCLAGLRFTGRLRALPEGTPCFGNEPLAQICAPVIEAQIVETMLINLFNFQTMVASKAARLRLAAGDRAIIDFGGRRAHGAATAITAARAAFVGGCEGTSNVEASRRFQIPCYGTMAHSFVELFADEAVAFAAFQRTFPQHSVLLVDTYDSLQGVRTAIELGFPFAGVRLDSGDLGALAVETRRLLDEAGRTETRIFASGGLDEHRLAALADSPIDACGVGTELVVSGDEPGCNFVYKLVSSGADADESPRFKTSAGKSTLPYAKQIYRLDGWRGDVLARYGEQGIEGRPLLETFLEGGRPVRERAPLSEARAHTLRQLDSLPDELRDLSTGDSGYPVDLSPQLKAAVSELGLHRTANSE